LSTDTNTAVLCAKKVGGGRLFEIAAMLQNKEKLSEGRLGMGYHLLQQSFLAENNIVFGLMLFRLLVLHQPRITLRGMNCQPQFELFAKWVTKQLDPAHKESALSKSPAARSMAWCTVSNAYAVFRRKHREVLLPLVEYAVVDISSAERTEVKQAAVTFLYNVALHQGQDTKKKSDDDQAVSDLQVSMLCTCLDGIMDEQDSVTQLRRLLVAARLLRNETREEKNATTNEPVASLIRDLGFDQSIRDLASPETDVGKLASDVAQLLDSNQF